MYIVYIYYIYSLIALQKTHLCLAKQAGTGSRLVLSLHAGHVGMGAGFVDLIKMCIMEDDRIKTLVENAVEKALAAYLAPSKKILVSRKAAAIRLNVDVSTLWRWDKSGYLPVTVRRGKFVYYSEEALRRLESGETLL